MKKRKLLLVKLGGSLITDKSIPLSHNDSIIARLAKEIKFIANKYPHIAIIVGNGAGSFGHFTVKKHGLGKEGNTAAVGAVQDIHLSVEQLNGMVVASLVASGLRAQPVSGQQVLEEGQLIKKLLNENSVPSVYGDILSVGPGYKVWSTEELFLELIKALRADFDDISVIFVTSVEGVLNPEGEPISQIESGQTGKISWGEIPGFDITGGMKQKLESAAEITRYARSVYIVGGKHPGNILKAVEGKKIGTKVVQSS